MLKQPSKIYSYVLLKTEGDEDLYVKSECIDVVCKSKGDMSVIYVDGIRYSIKGSPSQIFTKIDKACQDYEKEFQRLMDEEHKKMEKKNKSKSEDAIY